MSFLGIVLISSILIHLIFTYMLGICPILDTSRSHEPGVSFSIATIVVMTAAALLGWLVRVMTIDGLGMPFLEIIGMPPAVYGCVLLLERGIKALYPAFEETAGQFYPVLRAQAVVLGAAFILSGFRHGMLVSVAAGLLGGLAVVVSVLVLSSIRERLQFEPVPQQLQGAPVAVISGALLVMVYYSLDQTILVHFVR
jgi:Na+-translocating ferredoxin:NAD+ oxidoreductase subunit A